MRDTSYYARRELCSISLESPLCGLLSLPKFQTGPGNHNRKQIGGAIDPVIHIHGNYDDRQPWLQLAFFFFFVFMPAK